MPLSSNSCGSYHSRDYTHAKIAYLASAFSAHSPILHRLAKRGILINDKFDKNTTGEVSNSTIVLAVSTLNANEITYSP